jgi:hypothetical protein
MSNVDSIDTSDISLVEDNDPTPELNETKADAFKRLAKSRVNAALDRIRLIGNLSNRSSYDYTEEQVEKIEAALVHAIAEVKMKFQPGQKNKPTFEL